VHVFDGIGVQFPKKRWEVAVIRAGKLMTTRAALHLAFEFPSVPFADFEDVFAVGSFVVTGESVGVHPVCECGTGRREQGTDRGRGGGRGGFIEH
jgi:hypothetical protein